MSLCLIFEKINTLLYLQIQQKYKNKEWSDLMRVSKAQSAATECLFVVKNNFRRHN